MCYIAFYFIIIQVIESYESKILPGKGPLAEHQYWQNCETGLTMLVEQLKMPIVKRILALLEQALSPIASSFHYYQTELWKHFVEARDNNKFIQTLLRYFKVIIKILLIIYILTEIINIGYYKNVKISILDIFLNQLKPIAITALKNI